jgi:acyl carrier protein
MVIADRVRAIVMDQLGVLEAEVTLDASLRDDLDADSLDAIEIVITVEEEFGIEIPDDEAARLATYGDVLRYVETAVAARTQPTQ